jgi:ABC-type amino acid transport/signal transduction systems, periplasmic component/domain
MHLFIYTFLLSFAFQAKAAIRVYTIESAPLVQKSSDSPMGIAGLLGKSVGEKIFKSERNAEFRIVFTPWKRALSEVAKNKNALFFPLTKTVERANDYQWILKLATYDCWLFTFDPSVKIDSLEDLKKYKVGVLGGSLREEELRRHMGQKSRNIEGMTEDAANYKKLVSGRIQIWATQQPVLDLAMKHEGNPKLLPIRKLQKLLVQDMWLVGNKDMSERDLALVRDVFALRDKKGNKEASTLRSVMAWVQ